MSEIWPLPVKDVNNHLVGAYVHQVDSTYSNLLCNLIALDVYVRVCE